MNFEKLIEVAKKTVEKDGDHSVMFFVNDSDGKLNLISMQIQGDTDSAAEALKEIVEEMGSEEYYSVFSAWTVNSNQLNAQIKQEIEVAKMNPTKINAEQAVKNIINIVSQPPSKNPNRMECLVVSKYTKKYGTDAKIFPYKSENGTFVEWLENDELNNMDGLYTKWNVWHKYQIHLNEDADGKDNGKTY
jgi:hypothetical protein